MATYLDRILAAHRAAAAADVRPLAGLVVEARDRPPTRGFTAALRSASGGSAGGVAVIAEVKRRSPSRGDLASGLDPAALARAYERGGATCLSVLTDADFFGGAPSDLQAARDATTLPVLRKDFTVGPHDVCDARLMAAEAMLVGVNQRDLVSFDVDHDRAVRVGKALPAATVRVAESGIRGPDDARALAAAGFDAVLVGELLVTAEDPAAAVAALRSP
jgi:indole-3-glycerol phosphate synthase